jgi:hypothetical protein
MIGDDAEVRQAAAIVRELGGHLGTASNGWNTWHQVWFVRTEFAENEEQRLAALQELAKRRSVSIMFQDTNLTHQDVVELRKRLPKCLISRMVGNDLLDDPIHRDVAEAAK